MPGVLKREDDSIGRQHGCRYGVLDIVEPAVVGVTCEDEAAIRLHHDLHRAADGDICRHPLIEGLDHGRGRRWRVSRAYEEVRSRDASRGTDEGRLRAFAEHRATAGHPHIFHEPDLRLVGRLVMPQNVSTAVGVEVAGPDDAPRVPDEGRLAVLPHYGAAAGHPGAVHEPDLGLVRRAIVPKNIDTAVPVEVADPDDAPGRPDKRRLAVLSKDCAAAGYLRTVHEPDLGLVGSAIVP